MNKEHLEKLKFAVINMHISALLLLGICIPPIIVGLYVGDNMGFYFFLLSGIISIYNFIKQIMFMHKNPKYIKSKKDFYLNYIPTYFAF